MEAIGAKVQKSGWSLALVVGVPALAIFETRGLLDGYQDIAFWMLERGVPSSFLRLDGYLILLVAALLGARLAAGRGEVLRALGAESSWGRGLVLGSIIGMPSLLLASLVTDGPSWPGAAVVPLLLAPVALECFFRGLLLSIPVRFGGKRFWITAVLAGVAYGTVSLPWGGVPGSDWVQDFCLMTVEGVWFSWLVRSFGWNLWITIGLSAVLRATWTIFDVADGGSAVPWPDVALGVSAAFGTFMAVRHTRGLRRQGQSSGVGGPTV